MKILIVARGYRTQSLRAILPLNQLWEITHCGTTEEANLALKNASTPYDCILVMTNDYAEACEQPLTGCDAARRREAAVIYLDRRDMELSGHHTSGVFSLYKVSKQVSDRHGKGDDQWVFEYHAPCRKHSIQWGGLASLEESGGRVEAASPVRPAPSLNRMGD
ncbi:MAG: hypothetical protein L0H75_11100 [Nitrosospira sp.]|nr:hypothetical protein [Nitrosospira sp.]